MRKIVQGTRSDKGLENHSVLRSLFETARRQGKKPHEFFLVLLTKTTAQAQAALYRKPLSRPPLRCCEVKPVQLRFRIGAKLLRLRHIDSPAKPPSESVIQVFRGAKR
jgi:hypothetical protein